MRPRTPPVYRDSASAAVKAGGGDAALACDVSFVSDESTPPHAMVAREIERLGVHSAATLYWAIFDSLRAEYDRGGFLPHPAWVMTRIRHAIAAGTASVSDEQIDAAMRFFDRVNQVMFEQQTLAWLAGSPFTLNLYGAGWENHPNLSAHARGRIDDDATRLAIYHASRINLQAHAYGVVRPRLLEGVQAGGFFLMRFCPADLLERFFPPIWEFCSEHGIATSEALEEHATPGVRSLLAFAGRTIGVDLLRDWPNFIDHMRRASEVGYTNSAAALWPQYPAVSFSSKDELLGLIGRFLYDLPDRQRLAEAMRRQLNGRFAHVKVNRRMLTAQPSPREVAA